jgi:hypothetical protein
MYYFPEKLDVRVFILIVLQDKIIQQCPLYLILKTHF